MKEALLGMVAKLIDDGINLEETPALFEWSYPEEPFIKFKLLIVETNQSNLPLETPTLH